jgi:sterol desaturase/sphingolipid hydroxylase (fatty acid hydroxylase superfamily)
MSAWLVAAVAMLFGADLGLPTGPRWARVRDVLTIGAVAGVVTVLVVRELWVLLGVAAVALVLEKVAPRKHLPVLTAEKLRGASFSLLATVVQIVLPTLVLAAAYRTLPPLDGMAAQGVPIWLQVVVLLLVNDLKNYAVHRIEHNVGLLWRFHKLHHAALEVSYFTPRDHPSYTIEKFFTNFAMMYVLGPDLDASLIMWTIYASIQGLNHSNIDFPRWRDDKIPWWGYLISTPNYHAWHHTIHCGYDKNLADTFPFIDRIFGTAEAPRGNPREWVFGVEEHERLPASGLGQILSPFHRYQPASRPSPVRRLST